MEKRLIKNETLEKMREFFISEKFMLAQFLVACIITVFDIEIAGVFIFASLIAILLVLCDDILVTTLPFLLLCETVIKCYNSFDVFIEYIWIAIPILTSLFFHFIYYRRKIVIGKCFFGILAASIAITLGGVGFISKEDYFSLVSFYYVFGLGFGMLIIYILLCSHIDATRNYSLKEKFTDIMMYMGIFAVFMILEFYLENAATVIETKGIIYMQWRNNISTFFMLAMPFAAFKSIKRPSYIFLSLLFYGCILLAGSRGGLIFGGIELLMTISILIGIDKRHRWTFVAIAVGILIAVAAFFQDFYSFFGETFNRLVMGLSGSEQEVRLKLFARAFQDFNSNPIFGTGLAYFGNKDVHNSAEFALCWYHCEPLQIMGSLGIVGIVAFIFQFLSRFYVFVSKRTVFNITMLVAYIGLEMMSLVNPGVFCPLPYLFLITMFLAVVEKVNATEKSSSSLTKNIEKDQSEDNTSNSIFKDL